MLHRPSPVRDTVRDAVRDAVRDNSLILRLSEGGEGGESDWQEFFASGAAKPSAGVQEVRSKLE